MDDIKNIIEEIFEDKCLELGLPVLTEHVRSDEFVVNWDAVSSVEKDCIIAIKELARQLGSDPGSYSTGVLSMVFKNKQAVVDFMDAVDMLTCSDNIEEIDIEVRSEDLTKGLMEPGTLDFRDIIFDGRFEFTVHIYLDPSIVNFGSFDLDIEGDESEYDDSNFAQDLYEVRRRVKVNFRGKRRIKMQCKPGFKWDVEKKACLKITGAEVAKMRKSIRKSVRTKRSLGSAFKTRVLRKQRKARRFRKSMGLQ